MSLLRGERTRDDAEQPTRTVAAALDRTLALAALMAARGQPHPRGEVLLRGPFDQIGADLSDDLQDTVFGVRRHAWLHQNSPDDWQHRLEVLGQPFTYQREDGTMWQGDLFSRKNVLWADRGILIPGKTGMRVVNNKDAKRAAFDVLREVVSGVLSAIQNQEAVTA